jgi:hypothetical protein
MRRLRRSSPRRSSRSKRAPATAYWQVPRPGTSVHLSPCSDTRGAYELLLIIRLSNHQLIPRQTTAMVVLMSVVISWLDGLKLKRLS